VKRSWLVSALAAICVAHKLDAQITQREYAARRDALLAKLPDAIVVVLGGREPAEDFLEFDQTPGMEYLSGYNEPNASLLLVKQGRHESQTLFVQPRNPAAETWTGRRYGVDGATKLTGMSARDAVDFLHVLDSLGGSSLPFYIVGSLGSQDTLAASPDEQLVAALQRQHPQLKISSANDLVEQLRGRKTDDEMALIKRAVEITVAAQRDAFQTVRVGAYEYEVEATIESTFRKNGAERPSFATIVGSGPNSTTLHYGINDRQIRAGDVVVMDIGASFHGYAADVTRTVPANGVYSAEQRAVYQIVRDAQAAAEVQAQPGADARIMSDSATAVLARGLTQLGLIESPAATYETPSGPQPQYRLYYMHGLGHGIGLEVHDPDQFYYTGKLAEGSAFTIEPGIYVRDNLLDILADTPRNRVLIAKIRPAVEKYKNVGVRIEDDYVITSKGLEWISRAPREIAEIETLMRRPTP
jgi:Xaa-Pro aminopeptidase